MLNQPLKQEIIKDDQINKLPLKSFSVIIPAYNEEKRIGQTIMDLDTNFINVSEIIVVFDGNDHTSEVALASSKKVKIIRSNLRLGQGGAVLEGIKRAQGDVVCFIDADGAAPWYEVIRICSLVNEQTPAVFGSRWARGAKIERKESWRNVVGGRVFHYLSFAVLGIKEKDSFCGLKAFRKDLAMKLANKVTIRDRTFNIAISYNLKLMGIKPLEVGIEWSHKDGTQLPVNIKVIAIMFLSLLGLRVAHSRLNHSLRNIVLRFRTKIDFY